MDDIIEKIKKLFRLAESDNENEASLALKRAETLMRKHNIKSVDLCEKIEITELTYHEGRLMGWKKLISQIIAELFFCKTGSKGMRIKDFEIKKKHIFIGTAGNVTTCEEVYKRLISWINLKANLKYPGSPVSIKNEYKNGIAFGILRRVSEILEERKSENNSMALVVVNNAVENHTKNWRTGPSMKPPRVGKETIEGVTDAIEAPIFQEVK